MRGNLDRGMGFRTVQLMAAAVSVILVLCVTTGIIGAFAKADDERYVCVYGCIYICECVHVYNYIMYVMSCFG